MADKVNDALGDHIKSLSIGNPDSQFVDTPTGEDSGDILLDEPLDLEDAAMPKRILGSEDPDEVETADEGTSDLKDPEEEEKPDFQALYEKAQAAQGGLLSEVNKLREERRATMENIQYMQQMFLKEQEQRQKEEYQKQQEEWERQQREQYGDDVIDDPHVRFLANQVAELKRQQWESEQQREGRVRAVQEQYEANQRAKAEWNQKLTTLQQQEEQFAAQHPDYNDAYEYAFNKRKEMYVRRGWTPEQAHNQLLEEERYLMDEQLAKGGNIAEEVYRLAQDYGYRPGGNVDKPAPAKPAEQGPAGSSFNKIRDALGSASVGQMNGGPGNSGNEEYISIEKFYETVPEHIRAQVHSDPDQFEMLGRYGKVKVTW